MSRPLAMQSVDSNEKSAIKISVVMPAYNEVQQITAAIGRIKSILSGISESYEIIVVDDGSTDQTFGRIMDLATRDRSIVGIRQKRNKGKGAAVKRAAEVVRGDAIVIIDSDMEIDAVHIQNYLGLLSDYDICIASKRHPQSSYDAPLLRKFLSLSFSRFVRLSTGVKFADSQTGFKAMRGKCFKQIMNVIAVKRYAYDVEVLAVANLLNLRVAELPVKIKQEAGFSKKAIVYMVLDVMGVAYRLHFLKWYQKNLANPYLRYKPMIPI